MAGPLSGIRVLDFGWVWAGAVPGQIMAFLGAEVIKVESRSRVDYMRVGRPIVGNTPDPEQQPMFHNINRGKLGVTIDISTDRGRDLVLDLVEKCDVVIENFAPGVLERRGLDYDKLLTRRSDLIMLSISGGGQHGPISDLRTYAGTVSAYTGLDALCGYEGEQPTGLQQSYPDPNASMHGALGVLALLYQRGRIGCGDYLDLAQMTANLMTIGEAMVYEDLFDEPFQTPGNSAESGQLLHDCLKCLGNDEWVAVEVQDDVQLRALDVLLTADGGPVGQSDRAERLERWCLGRSAIDAMEQLQAVGVPAGAVTTAEDRFKNRHYQARGTYQETEHPVIGWEVVYREPWIWQRDQSDPVRRAPLLGEANEYVVLDLLGRSRAEYDELVESHVLN